MYHWKFIFTCLLIFLWLAIAGKILTPVSAEVAPHFSCIRTDSNPKTATPIKPNYLQTLIDPEFGTKITRITGDAGTTIPNIGGTWATNCRHHYSKDQAWNADGTLLFLWKDCGGGIILDGKTYQPLFRASPPGEERWHPTDPNLFIYVSGSEIGYWNVHTKQTVRSRQFSGYGGLQFGPSEGNPSFDGKVVAALAASSPSGSGGQVAFAYNIETDQKYPDIPIPYRVGSLTISPLGNYIVVNGDITNPNANMDETLVYDLQGNQVGPLWETYGRPSHFDVTVDSDGNQVAVGLAKSGTESGRTIKRRLIDGQVTAIGPGGSHTSTRSIRRPGWAYVTRPGGVYADEVLAVKLDGSLVERLVYLPNNKVDYPSEVHASPNPDGNKIIAAANWKTSTAVNDYVIEVTCAPPVSSPTPTPSISPIITLKRLLTTYLNHQDSQYSPIDSKINLLDFAHLISNLI